MALLRGALVGAIGGALVGVLGTVLYLALGVALSNDPDTRDVALGYGPLFVIAGLVTGLPLGAGVGAGAGLVGTYVAHDRPLPQARRATAWTAATLAAVTGVMAGALADGLVAMLLVVLVLAGLAFGLVYATGGWILGSAPTPPGPRPRWQRPLLVATVGFVAFWGSAFLCGELLTSFGVDRGAADAIALGGALAGAGAGVATTLGVTRR